MAQPLIAPPAEHPHEYLTKPRPLVFPTDATMPENTEHFALRATLYFVLCRELAAMAWIGSDQFVYFDASDPAKSVAPDLFVRRGGPNEHFTSWKVWERGAPEMALEIVSESDASLGEWEKKLTKYHALGVLELFRYEALAAPALRVWDRVDGDLVERRVDGGRAACRVIGLELVVVGEMLRLSRDGAILPTEPERADAEAERADAEAERADAEAGRADAAMEQAARLRAKLLAAGIDPEA